MTATERCELTELLVDACGCRKHRGGQTLDEEVVAEQLRTRARLLAAPGGLWWPAVYAGTCVGCRGWFTSGTAIRRAQPAAAFTAPVYIAECCEEDHRW